MTINITDLKFDANGLIPVIVQDANTNQVLTLAYMNAESLRISIEENRTCFYSRSRQKLWRKGETSGNYQQIVSITPDCDSDALLVRVRPAGPACHTGNVSCFDTPHFSLAALQNLIEDRKNHPREGSYTNYLMEKGLDKILKKIGEESSEVIIAAKNNNAELIYEIADLCYHALVLMTFSEIKTEQILSELQKRHVVDKKTKQETQNAD